MRGSHDSFAGEQPRKIRLPHWSWIFGEFLVIPKETSPAPSRLKGRPPAAVWFSQRKLRAQIGSGVVPEFGVGVPKALLLGRGKRGGGYMQADHL